MLQLIFISYCLFCHFCIICNSSSYNMSTVSSSRRHLSNTGIIGTFGSKGNGGIYILKDWGGAPTIPIPIPYRECFEPQGIYYVNGKTQYYTILFYIFGFDLYILGSVSTNSFLYMFVFSKVLKIQRGDYLRIEACQYLSLLPPYPENSLCKSPLLPISEYWKFGTEQ